MHTHSKFSSITTLSALLAALTVPTAAQDQPMPSSGAEGGRTPSSTSKSAHGAHQVEMASPGLTLATKLKGVNVMDANSKTLGEVEDLIVEPSGATLAVIDRDRDRAEGGGLVLLPLDLLQARLDVDEGEAEEAVEDRSEGKRPESPQVESFLLRAKTELFASSPAMEKAQIAELDAAGIAAVRSHWAGKTGEPGAMAPDAKPTAKEAQGSRMCVAKAVGQDVKSPTDEALGQVKDVVVDLPSGKVLYVVISSGGVLGVGETFHGITLDSLVANGDAGFTLNTDLKTLDSSPGIDLDRLPSRPSLQSTAKVSLTDGSDAQRTPR